MASAVSHPVFARTFPATSRDARLGVFRQVSDDQRSLYLLYTFAQLLARWSLNARASMRVTPRPNR